MTDIFTDISEERIDSVFNIELCLLLACSPHSETSVNIDQNTGRHIQEGSRPFDIHLLLKFDLGLAYTNLPSPNGFGLGAHSKGEHFPRAYLFPHLQNPSITSMSQQIIRIC
jgi:hypothetical protein